MGKRKSSKRLKGFGIPIDVCVKYERMVGVKTGCEPTKAQSESVTKAMVAALTMGVAHIELSARDHELIKQEKEQNENR